MDVDTISLLRKEVIKMLFNNGTYQHESGFIIFVIDGKVMLSPDHPLSMRLSDVFDTNKWTKIK